MNFCEKRVKGIAKEVFWTNSLATYVLKEHIPSIYNTGHKSWISTPLIVSQLLCWLTK